MPNPIRERAGEAIRNYATAIGLVAIAYISRLSLDLITSQTLAYATFYPAVLLAALWGGPGPGLAAVVLSTLAGWYAFMPPRWELKIVSPDIVISVLLYAGCATLLVWIADRYRRTLASLRSEQQARELLMRELAHRSKNTLAIAQAIVAQTLKHDAVTVAILNNRLSALASANDVLLKSSDHTADLQELIVSSLAPFGLHRMAISGDGVRLNGEDSRSVALLIHELATNAAKHGALSCEGGIIDVRWRAQDGEVTLTWWEQRGPAVREPDRRGFGSRLIANVTQSMSGTSNMQFLPDGLRCTLKFTPTAATPDVPQINHLPPTAHAA